MERKSKITMNNTFFLTTIIFSIILLAMPAMADISTLDHNASVELSPEWSQSNQEIEYEFKITNEIGSDPIQQVWIYKNPNYDDFVCEEIVGWNLGYHTVIQPGTNSQVQTDACLWVAQADLTDGFDEGNSKTFRFNSTTPSDPQDFCELKWYVQTIDTYPGDTTGQANMNFDITGIDNHPPTITTDVSEDPLDTCISTDPESPCYIRKDTDVQVTASDDAGLECNSGIDYCTYRIYRNGDFVDEYKVDGDGQSVLEWSFNFADNSNHTVIIDCVDVAGNSADTVTNYFFVDSEAPVTTHEVHGPYYQTKEVLFINGVSNITLDVTDNKFGPEDLTTYYAVYTCIEYDTIYSYAGGPSYEEYTGQAIGDLDEGCYVLRYYSEDPLNQEAPNTLQFTVDKTAPEMEKIIGSPKIPFDSGLGSTDHFTQFTEDEISLWQADRKFPSGDVESVSFADRDNVLKVSIIAELQDSDSFRHFEGIKKKGDFGKFAQVDLYVPDDWQTADVVNVGFWVSDDPITAYPIIVYRNGDDIAAGFYTWDGLGGYDYSGISVEYDDWNTLAIVLNVQTGVANYFINGQSAGGIPANSLTLGQLFFNHFNDGNRDYEVYWSMLGTTVRDWYITSENEISLNCYDEGAFQSGVKGFYYRYANTQDGDSWNWYSGNGEDFVFVEGHEHTFSFPESSLHKLEWYCEDNVNKESNVSVQYYKVDNTAPEIFKSLNGTYEGDCPPAPNSDEVCYVKGGTELKFFSEDVDSIHAVHGVTCEWDIVWNETSVSSGSWKEGEEHPVFTFVNDSEHTVTIVCEDALGNSFSDVETFKVDSLPPVTNKTYGQPTVVRNQMLKQVYVSTYSIQEAFFNELRWITSQTPISLLAEDNKVGVEGIYWRYSWVSNDTCEAYPSRTGYYEHNNLDLGGDYPSTNELNKEEENPYQSGVGPHFDVVDVGVGYVTVEFNMPYSYDACFGYRSDGDVSQAISDEHYYPGLDDDLYPYTCVNAGSQTVTLNATQYVEIRLTHGAERDWDFNWTKVYVELDTENFNFDEGNETNFNINQSSCHVIEYFAVDKFGNTEEIQRQFVMVDNEEPLGVKTVGEPNIPVEDSCEATVEGLGIPEDVTVYHNGLYWAWASPCAGGCSNIEPIAVPGWRYATEEEWANRPDLSAFGTANNFKCASEYFDPSYNHCDWFDGEKGYVTSVPKGSGLEGHWETWLVFDADYGQCDDYFATQDTEISFTCLDAEPHPVGGERIGFKLTWYENQVNGQGKDITSQYCGDALDQGYCIVESTEHSFIFMNDSTHVLEWYCEDELGNRAEQNMQVYHVDTMPPQTTHEVEGPKYVDENGWHYINGVTTISLDAEDPEPHPSGLQTTYYRWFLAEDSVCEEDSEANYDSPLVGFFQGFEEDASGWFEWAGATISRVSSGTNGITSSTGSYHAILGLGTPESYSGRTGSLFTRWGGFEDEFPVGGYSTSVDVYLDTVWADETDKMLSFSSAINNAAGDHLRDFIIHIGTETVSGQFVVTANNNAPGNPRGATDKEVIDESGWYTLKHSFAAVGGMLEVTHEVIRKSDNSVVYSRVQTTSDEMTNVGGNRYGWFVINEFEDLPVDNAFKTGQNFVEWNVYEGAFNIPEESCHVVEYLSVDRLGNVEDVNVFVTFVDLTAPELFKEIGMPRFALWEARQFEEIIVPSSAFSGHEYFETNVSVVIEDGYIKWIADLENVTQRTTTGFQLYIELSDGTIFTWGVNPSEGEVYKDLTSGTPIVQPAPAGFVSAGVSDDINYQLWIPLTVFTDNFYWAVNSEITAPGAPGFSSSPSVQSKFPANFGGWQNPTVGTLLFEIPDWYVTSDTVIGLSCVDQDPHPSGVDYLSFRIKYSEDDQHNLQAITEDYCSEVGGTLDGDWCNVPIGSNYLNGYKYSDFVEEPGFPIQFEDVEIEFKHSSFHSLEFSCTDNVGKTSDVRLQHYWVDNEGPETAKVIAQPKTQMSEGLIELGYNYFNEDAGFNPALTTEFCDEADENCMEVTLLTKINMACNDPEPHPSGVQATYFKVHWDGDDVTNEYCADAEGEMVDGYCRIEGEASYFHFKKESWHKLEYYCEDNLGNKGESDIEYFKVEGTAFKIELNKKWNLISVPVKLKDNSMDEVFQNNSDSVVSVWTYHDGEWEVYTPNSSGNTNNLDTMHPGFGYWILTTDASTLTIGGSLLSPAVTPPMREIVPGWNLVGYHGIEGAPYIDSVPYFNGPVGNGVEASCMFGTLSNNVHESAFTSLWTYWELDNPDQWIALGENSSLDAGAGYWLFYSGSSPGIYGLKSDCSV